MERRLTLLTDGPARIAPTTTTGCGPARIVQSLVADAYGLTPVGTDATR